LLLNRQHGEFDRVLMFHAFCTVAVSGDGRCEECRQSCGALVRDVCCCRWQGCHDCAPPTATCDVKIPALSAERKRATASGNNSLAHTKHSLFTIASPASPIHRVRTLRRLCAPPQTHAMPVQLPLPACHASPYVALAPAEHEITSTAPAGGCTLHARLRAPRLATAHCSARAAARLRRPHTQAPPSRVRRPRPRPP
jgi:hypothetical protein